MRMTYLRILMLLVVVAIVGCNASESVNVTPPTTSAMENAKSALNEIAESGELGSGMMTVREGLEASEEGKALLPDLDALEALTAPEEIKAKAKEMADKLGGGAAAEAETETE